MKQETIYPKRLHTWRFHGPGTIGTVYMTGSTEEEAIISLARIHEAMVFTDQTLFEGKGGWILQKKLAGHYMIITRGTLM